jgi:Domain of unknown function DUF11
MNLRTRSLLALTASAAALVGLAGPAAAAPTVGPAGTVQLTVTKDGPIFGDNNTLIYDIHVTNSGPATATNVVVTHSAWFCPPAADGVGRCTIEDDPDNPGAPLLTKMSITALAPGQTDEFPVTSYMIGDSSGTVRTTIEVTHVDQEDSQSVAGTCASGWNLQPDCDSDVVSLS